jgi:tetratricopeptide (TPR) repeat protein
MGGIGKTELVLQYALAQKDEYPAGLCWLRARDQEIATQIVTFAQAHLGLTPPDQLEIEAQVRFCWQQWPEGDALVVLDDVTDYQAIEPYLPPPDPRFKLLITTRSQLGSSVKDFSVEELDENSAIALLASLVKDGRIQAQADDARALCEWVGNLPLSLELLGRYLAYDNDLSIRELLLELETVRLRAEALSAIEAGMTAQRGVLKALELSWKDLSEEERELAYLLGMFATAPISWEIVEQCFETKDPKVLKKTRSKGLMSRSLVKRVGEGSYQLHQIVQEYFRMKLEQRPDQGQGIKSDFCGVMVAITKNINPTPTIDEIEGVRGVIVHLEEVVNQWIDSLTHENLVWLFEGIGRFYQGQGNYATSESWRSKCLKVTQKLLGQDHPLVAISLNNLAQLFTRQGRYNEAELRYLESLQISIKLLDHWLVSFATNLNNFAQFFISINFLDHWLKLFATSLNNLAQLFTRQGRYDEAELVYLESLQICKKLLGHKNLLVATVLNNLAELCRNQERYERAELLFKQALNMRKKLLSKEHPDIATSLNDLGLLYTDQERYEEAESFFWQSLNMNKKLLGEEHLDVANNLSNLADLYYYQKRYMQAESFYRQSLQMREKLLGKEHPDVATNLNNLAVLCDNQERYEEAEPLYRQSLQVREKLLGEEHPDVANSLNNLAVLYTKQARYEKAELLYRQLLQTTQKLKGNEHLSVLNILLLLANLSKQQRKYDEARNLCLQAISIAQASLGSNHPNTLKIVEWLNSLPE